MLKKTLFSFFFVLLLVPNVSLAANVERQALIRQIEVLTKEVVRLQALLLEKQKEEGVFYPSTSETRYNVINGELVRGRAEPRPTHVELFEQLSDVVGPKSIEDYISEFRVGYVRDTSQENYIEGYVELLPGTDMWVLTLRRDGTKPLNNEERKLFTELFVHEYAHILLYSEPSFATTFTKRFWDDATYRESARAKRLYEREGYGALEDAHKGQSGNFVSGYAMLNPDEDMAETFGAFVEREYPVGTSKLSDKIRFFYTDETLVAVRTELRENLGL